MKMLRIRVLVVAFVVLCGGAVWSSSLFSTKDGRAVRVVSPFAPGPPLAALAPPGVCAFSEEWTPAPLLSRSWVSESTALLRFGLEGGRSLGLSTCACLLAKSGDAVRPYTPVSTNALQGAFELLVKVYPDGTLSKHLSTMSLGETVDFKHIPFNVKIQYPFSAAKIGMIAGGSGVTPMIQALHAILGTADDPTTVSLLASHKTREAAIALDALDEWAATHSRKFTAVTTLTQEPADSDWSGARGRIDEAMIRRVLPPPTEDALIFVCGPPSMYDALTGPRGEPKLAGLLAKMGYNQDNVIKF